jgi:hypothetical protein
MRRSTLDAVVLGRRDPVDQFPGVQEARVHRVDATGLHVTVDALPGPVFGPVRGWANETPPAGTACLVAFAGYAADRPWLLAYDGWAAP